jgi:hypothetical protein
MTDKEQETDDNIVEIDLQTPQHRKKSINPMQELLQDDEKGWTVKSNLLLLLWLSRSLKLLRSHYSRFWWCRFWMYFLAIINVVISNLSGELSFFNAVGRDSTISQPISISVGSLALISGMMIGILTVLKLGDMVKDEKYAITKFSKLVREIEMVIYSDIEDRPNAKEFLDRVNEKYYKYHTASDVREASKMSYTSLRVNLQDYENNGEIEITDDFVKLMRSDYLKRTKSDENITVDVGVE